MHDKHSRRDFIKKVAIGTSALTMPNLPVFAGPFIVDQQGHLIPADKKLSNEWVKSLYLRGKLEIYEKDFEMKKFNKKVQKNTRPTKCLELPIALTMK